MLQKLARRSGSRFAPTAPRGPRRLAARLRVAGSRVTLAEMKITAVSSTSTGTASDHPAPRPPASPRLPRTRTTRGKDTPRGDPLLQTPTRTTGSATLKAEVSVDMGATWTDDGAASTARSTLSPSPLARCKFAAALRQPGGGTRACFARDDHLCRIRGPRCALTRRPGRHVIRTASAGPVLGAQTSSPHAAPATGRGVRIAAQNRRQELEPLGALVGRWPQKMDLLTERLARYKRRASPAASGAGGAARVAAPIRPPAAAAPRRATDRAAKQLVHAAAVGTRPEAGPSCAPRLALEEGIFFPPLISPRQAPLSAPSPSISSLNRSRSPDRRCRGPRPSPPAQVGLATCTSSPAGSASVRRRSART